MPCEARCAWPMMPASEGLLIRAGPRHGSLPSAILRTTGPLRGRRAPSIFCPAFEIAGETRIARARGLFQRRPGPRAGRCGGVPVAVPCGRGCPLRRRRPACREPSAISDRKTRCLYREWCAGGRGLSGDDRRRRTRAAARQRPDSETDRDRETGGRGCLLWRRRRCPCARSTGYRAFSLWRDDPGSRGSAVDATRLDGDRGGSGQRRLVPHEYGLNMDAAGSSRACRLGCWRHTIEIPYFAQ